MRLPINDMLTYVLSCAVSKLWLIICQIFAIDRGSLYFNALAGVFPHEYPDKIYFPETRMIVLPDTEDRTILSSFF